MVHAKVRNAKTNEKYKIFGPSATYLLNAIVHALFLDVSLDSSPIKVVASITYYPVSIKIKKLNRPNFVP